MFMQLLLLLRARAHAVSPRAWLITAGAAIVAAAVLGLYWKGRHDAAARDQTKTQAAMARANVAGAEAQGARDTVARVEAVAARREAAQAAVSQLTHEALQSEDAHALLPTYAADRLRADDRQLCDSAPELAGCAAAPDAR